MDDVDRAMDRPEVVLFALASPTALSDQRTARRGPKTRGRRDAELEEGWSIPQLVTSLDIYTANTLALVVSEGVGTSSSL